MDTALQNDKAQRDYQLVVAARDNGDQRAYADLMSFYRVPVYTMLLRMTRNPAEADDLTMEAFNKAFSQLHAFSPTNTFSSWLFSIASHHGIDHIRHNRLQTVPLSSMEVSLDGELREYPVPSGDANPEEQMIGSQTYRLMHEVVAKLPPRYRKIVEMRYFDELSINDISVRLRMPEGTVKVQLSRARQLLGHIIHINHKNSL